MKQYKDWQPTAFDRKNAAISNPEENYSEWYVLTGLSSYRPSSMDKSNWEFLQNNLNSDNAHIVYFSHWASDFELMLIRPNTEDYEKALEYEDYIANYRPLDEDRMMVLELEMEESLKDSEESSTED